MKFVSTLRKARLIHRYKRFLADVDLGSSVLTLHCPNTGSMKNCAEPGWDVWYSWSENGKRKYPGTWELAVNGQGDRILINTALANKLVADALERDSLCELSGYQKIVPEVRFGEENSRMDFMLLEHQSGLPDCVVEVKSVTLLEGSGGQGFFPDAVTSRGQKHLRELMHARQMGNRAVLIFCVNHTGIRSVAPAAHIDRAYADLFSEAVEKGVEVYAYRMDTCVVADQIESVSLGGRVPVTGGTVSGKVNK